VIDGANHFFHGYTDLIANHMHDHMNVAQAGRAVAVNGPDVKKIAS